MTEVLKKIGISPEMGGAAILVAGLITASNTNTNTETGEVYHMVEMAWFGATHYVVCEPSCDLAQLPSQTKVVVALRQKKSKKGFYGDRDCPPVVISINGKAA